MSCLFLALSIDAFLEYKRNGMGRHFFESLGVAIILIGFIGAFGVGCKYKSIFFVVFSIPGSLLLLACVFMDYIDTFADSRNRAILISLMFFMIGILESFLIDIWFGVIIISIAVAFLIYSFVAYKS